MSRCYRQISLLLSLFLILTTIATPIVFADNSDLEGHWSRDEINKMLEKGYLSGYPDGTFQPDAEMSRAQFVSVINKVFEYVEECDISFDDVNANDWFYKDVRIAYKNGYIKGMSKNKFAPNQTIKRQDVAVILARVLGLVEDVSYCDNFTDGSQISDYAKGAVGAIAKAGIMIGNDNKTFEPTGNIKRSEIVVAGRASDYKKEHQEPTEPTGPTKPTKPTKPGNSNNDNDNDNELVSIKITSFPKQIYYVGEVLDITGIVVKAVYKNGQETVLDESLIKVTGFDSTKPVIDKEITVKFGEKTTTYKISVKEYSTYDLVKQVGLITNKEIEIKFNSNVANANNKDDFEVYVDEVKTTDFEFLSYFSNMVTLRLKNSIDPAKNVIKVKIVDATISDGTNAADVNKTYTALNVPYYSVQDIGLKSKIVVRASSDVPLDVVKQVSEGINKMVGRSEFMTLEAAKQGLTISVVGPNENVYMIPEYRELYNAVDVATRVTIPGTVEKPIIVTTASDIMRERGSDEYALINDFTKLFLEIGVKVGALNTPLGSDDNPDLYNIYKHLEEAYSNAKSKDLWQNGMTSSIEEYFAKGTMIYYEVTPESEDGSWSNGIGPVSTRLELRTYDRALFDVLVEVYGEFEYISPYRDVETKPWFVGTQANRYGIDGNELPDAAVYEVNLISGNQIEVKFNREVKNAEDVDKYKITFTPTGGEAKEISGFSVLPYSWNTITLQLGGWSWNGTEWEWLESPNLLTGPVGTDIKGDNLVKGQYVCTKVTTSGAITTTPTAIAGEIKVEVIGDNITDWSGNPVGNGAYDVVLNPVIGQVKRTDGVGIYVYADKDVAKESIDMAACYIDEILSNKTYGQGIADGINAGNGGLAIIAYGNHAYMQPELRSSYDQFYLYVEGFGGGIAQTSEANINRDKRATRYDNEFILGHEFGHTIHLTGIEKSFPALYKEIQDIYDEVVLGEGLWPTSYAGSNAEEYFATLSNIWHSTMRESTDGTFNGTWCPVNTREELYRYDRKGYDLMKKIYYSGTQTDDEIIKNEKIFIGTPWESYTVSNVYDIDSSRYTDIVPTISIKDGMTQPIFDATKSIYETVFVEVPCDTDKDGERDLVEVWIRRPQETNKGMKVPVIMESSPYRNGVGNSPNHDVLGEQQINEDTTNNTYDDIRFKGMTAADWDLNAPGIPSARTSTDTSLNGTERTSFNTSWYTYFASRGYAIVYAASIGNKNSDGFVNCGGVEETLACKTIIEWLNGKAKAYTNRTDNKEVAANWSTGNVAMTGVSYAGTLPIATAATGVEGLKTIIPVAGITSWYDSYRYGGAVLAPDENQGEDLDSVSLFSFSRDKNPENYPEDVKLAWEAHLAKMNVDFDRATGDYNAFWDERNYLITADRIKSSVLIVAGLNDWNVKPKHFDELWRACEKYNVPNKMILHQGQHMSAYNLQGLDYMTNVNKWLDHWLYGIENDWDSMSDVTIQNNKDLSWEGFDEWPINGTSKKLYLVSGEENATGSLKEIAPMETTETFKDTYLIGEKRNTESSNIVNWTDYIVGAYEPDKAITDRVLYLTSELTEDIRFSGTAKINLDIKLNTGKGTLSAMIVDYGKDLRPSPWASTVIPKGIDYGGGGGYANIVNFVLNNDTDYKVVTRGWADVQNPNPSGKIYLDAEDTNYIPEYYYQTVAIEPNKYYNYAFCLEPMDYIFKAGHRIGIIVYSNDAQYSIIPEEKTQFTIKLGEKSYIDIPIDKD